MKRSRLLRRKHRPVSVERDACLELLGLLGKKIEWHHMPPLSQRPQDPHTGLYTPDENDPRHIVPMEVEAHRLQTVGDRRPLSGDISVAAKIKRVTKDQEEFRRKVLAKEPGQVRALKRTIQSRPFPKRKKIHEPAS
jgi:hypothetical protein